MPSIINSNTSSGLVTSGSTDGVLQLQTASTTAVTIDASQNVGVGVTPSAWGNIFKVIDFSGNGSIAGSASAISLFDNAYYNGTSYVYKTTNLATRYTLNTGVHSWYTAASGTAGNAITFTQAMTLDASGNLLVGKTALNDTVAGAQIAGSSATYPGRICATVANSTNATEGIAVYSSSVGAYRFYVSMDGKVNATNTTIAAISDQRLKENIRDLDDGLSSIMALQPRKFDWKEGKGADIKNVRGFVAQEFETVFPDLIDTWKDPSPEGEEPYKSVRADLIPVLVKAIQELSAQVTELKAEVQALKGA